MWISWLELPDWTSTQIGGWFFTIIIIVVYDTCFSKKIRVIKRVIFKWSWRIFQRWDTICKHLVIQWTKSHGRDSNASTTCSKLELSGEHSKYLLIQIVSFEVSYDSSEVLDRTSAREIALVLLNWIHSNWSTLVIRPTQWCSQALRINVQAFAGSRADWQYRKSFIIKLLSKNKSLWGPNFRICKVFNPTNGVVHCVGIWFFP